MAETYFEFVLKNVKSELEDQVTGLCFDHGAKGVSEDLEFSQRVGQYEPETVQKSHHNLVVYFTEFPSDAFKLAIRVLDEEIKISYSEEENKDWLEEWKKGFKEFELLDDIWIVPSWVKPPKSMKKKIVMDPGMAFGTGTHETTQLAARMMSQLKPYSTCLDVGTGTGILAMVAEFYSWQKIVGVEIDPVAREVARENVANNECENIRIVDTDLKSVSGPFDLVIANIIDGVLIDIQEDLRHQVRAGGLLLVTGIIDERQEAFEREFELPENWVRLSKDNEGDWYGYLFFQKGDEEEE